MARVSEIEQLAQRNSASFESSVSAELSSGVKQVEIDLADTGFVDCSGLGALAAVCRRARRGRNGARVRLVNLSQRVQRIIELTRLDDLLTLETAEISRWPIRPATPALTRSRPRRTREASSPLCVALLPRSARNATERVSCSARRNSHNRIVRSLRRG